MVGAGWPASARDELQATDVCVHAVTPRCIQRLTRVVYCAMAEATVFEVGSWVVRQRVVNSSTTRKSRDTERSLPSLWCRTRLVVGRQHVRASAIWEVEVTTPDRLTVTITKSVSSCSFRMASSGPSDRLVERMVGCATWVVLYTWDRGINNAQRSQSHAAS